MSFKALEAAVIGICNTTFGTPATYTPAIGVPVSLDCVFDNAFVEINGVPSLSPVARIALSDLASAPVKGDQMTISSVTYRILRSEADSYGGSLLILQKV